MLLMSILTNLSGCVPLVRTLYAHRLYSPHFFFAAVAPAGSGKGVVALSALLGSKIHREMEENNRRERKEYEQKMLEWEAEQKRAFREKRKPDISLKPEEPRWHVLNVPPNTSKSQLMTDSTTPARSESSATPPRSTPSPLPWERTTASMPPNCV